MQRALALYLTDAALVVARGRPLHWHDVRGGVEEVRALLDQREIKRHKTAISRKDFSVPVKALMRNNMLTKDTTMFDYGCGRGDDIRLLKSKGYNVGGWDPYWAPDNKKTKASIVNLGFVINVIEDPDERNEALSKAFKLASDVLVVSTRPPMKHSFKSYGDGFVTSSDTFQKFWKTGELKAYLQDQLGVEPVSSGSPCCFFCFKNDKAKERMMG
jgi:DNA phosphorothioation-associated putative methyltransferase